MDGIDEIYEAARDVALRLQSAGHEAYFAGGAVRDHLLGRKPHDYDVATSARPGAVEKLFRRTLSVGKQFGVIVVMMGEHAIEVATFRADGDYGDGRRPDSITFTNAVEDVRRRDFTINGLLMCPDTGTIQDHVGGEADLKAGLLRTIGEPAERFEEDRLRILRAIRFAARLGFRIEEKTAAALHQFSPRAADPSPERIRGELDRIWSENNPALGLELLEEYGLLSVVLPELAQKKGVPLDPRLIPQGQNLDAAERQRLLLHRLGEGPHDPVLVWSLLLSDQMGTQKSDWEWPGQNAVRAKKVMKRLRASKADIQAVGEAVALRSRLLFCAQGPVRRALISARSDRERLAQLRWVESGYINDPQLIEVDFPQAEALPAPLVRGNEAIAAGAPKGRSLGRLLRRVRVLQLKGRLSSKDEALKYLSAWAEPSD